MKKKRIIKLIASVFISAAMIIMSGCTGSEAAKTDFSIITTLFPQYDFARKIAGDTADVTLLLTPGSESHSYEPTPKDIARIQKADLFIYNGGESEVWVDEILKSSGNKDMKVLKLMDCVDLLEEDSEEDHHEHETEYDEHIFTSLRNSEKLIEDIQNAMSEVKPDSSELYKSNADKYKSELDSLDKKFTDMINGSKRRTVVFGDRFPFKYFSEDYGLECYAAFSGCSSETEASSATMSRLIDTVKNESIPVVFHIEFSSETICRKISDATGAQIALLHSCHNISKKDLESGVSYLDLMTQNYNELEKALN